MLRYTRQRTLRQRAILERDEETVNKWGAKEKAERMVVATVPCLWAPYVEASRARSATSATPERTISQVPALLLVPPGTDVAAGDWIKEVLTPAGAQLVAGPFRVIGVVPLEDHIELSLERP